MKNIRKFIGKKLFGSRVDKMVKRITPFLPKKGNILDLGAGTGLFTRSLRNHGYKVWPVDIKNRSYFKDSPSQIYNGAKLPFKNRKFDACILISVLHHTPDPSVVLAEAVRVASRVVVHENIVSNMFQRLYTYLVDSVLNQEFFGAMHSNKTDREWLKLFNKLGLKLVKVEYDNSYLFVRNSLYFLEKI